MKTAQARALGKQIAEQLEKGQAEAAYNLLAPTLNKRTPFAMLRHVGDAVGTLPFAQTDALLEQIAAGHSEGGWVVIASVLEGQMGVDLAGAFARCRGNILQAGIWYGADTLAEGLPGRALVADFTPALELLRPWRDEKSPWLRRACGASAHHWAKRSHGAPELAFQAAQLLDFLGPLFGEWNINAVKGVGWGLKTLGRYYPDLVANWLVDEILPRGGRYRALMLQKAVKYFPEENREAVKRTASLMEKSDLD